MWHTFIGCCTNLFLFSKELGKPLHVHVKNQIYTIIHTIPNSSEKPCSPQIQFAPGINALKKRRKRKYRINHFLPKHQFFLSLRDKLRTLKNSRSLFIALFLKSIFVVYILFGSGLSFSSPAVCLAPPSDWECYCPWLKKTRVYRGVQHPISDRKVPKWGGCTK